MLEFLVAQHPITLKVQPYMISWKLARKWLHQGDGFIDCQGTIKSFMGQKSDRGRMQESIGMVESA